MATLTAIQKIERHAKKIATGKHETVRPGLPFRINEAASCGDGVWQGDLGIEVMTGTDAPRDYHKLAKPIVQLVPGNTEGSRHCLDGTNGVEMWVPNDWPNVTQLGPYLVLSEERTILHPVHGAVTIAAGHAVLCSYQREWDAEQKQERRNAD